MTTSKIEEVARAIEAEASKMDPLPFDVCLAFGRAAIEAMAGATSGMVRAVDEHPDFLGYGDDSFGWIWDVMVSAALAEGEER